MAKVLWQDRPEEHDYPAAESYLKLLFPAREAEAVVEALRSGGVLEHFKAKDILRASGLPLLPADNAHVLADIKKVRDGKALSPILMVRTTAELHHHPIIADGYHRVCASYHIDENTDIPVVII